MKKNATLLLIFLLSLLLVSCYGSFNIFYKGNNVDYRTVNYIEITDATDSEFSAANISSLPVKYDVLVLTDLHFGIKDNVIPTKRLFRWLDKVKGTLEAPRFAISLGDSADTGSQEEFDEYLAFCKKLYVGYGIIVFNACGNHDAYQSHWDNWAKNCYPHTSFYKFETQGFSWYSLDMASGTIGEQQYNKLISEISHDPKPKIVYSHYPLSFFNFTFGYNETTERNLLIDKFYRNNVKCYMGGHNHMSLSRNIGFNDYLIPSFRYGDKWAILHVDENAQTATIEIRDK